MRRFLAAGLVVLAVAGCGSKQQSSVPQATSTISVPGVSTASSLASPSPIRSATAEAQSLEAEHAEAVYRQFLDRELALYKRGGAQDARAELSGVAADPLLKEEIASMRAQLNSGLRATSNSRYALRIRQVSLNPQGVTLVSCEDYRALTLVNRQGKVVRVGKLYRATVQIHRTGAGFRVVNADSSEVTSC